MRKVGNNEQVCLCLSFESHPIIRFMHHFQAWCVGEKHVKWKAMQKWKEKKKPHRLTYQSGNGLWRFVDAVPCPWTTFLFFHSSCISRVTMEKRIAHFPFFSLGHKPLALLSHQKKKERDGKKEETEHNKTNKGLLFCFQLFVFAHGEETQPRLWWEGFWEMASAVFPLSCPGSWLIN